MNELDLPLRSPALYNPHLLSRDELLALFAAREDLLNELLSDLRTTPPEEPAQHHLVVGQRGMGKTMLLRRLQVAIEDDSELGERWLPLSFPEEQYNVVTLSDFWLNCVDALSDRLEAGERFPDAVEALDRAVEEIRDVQDETHRAERALDALVGTAESLDRRLLLLVDNADLILDRIGEQDWSLREILSSRPKVTFIGASAAMLESTYEYGRAFYDFFRIHELVGLSVEETKRFLLRYAEAQNNAHVREVVEAEPARLRVLHTLTGGNPRTLVLLFNIFAHGAEGDVRADLEQLLDQCTPIYKARFEALPTQAQQVVDALALHWDPVSAGELAEWLRMKVNQVSAQLNRLTQMGVVEKVPYEPDSKTGFQIAERFFNIWYLMRASRRVRRRLIWLVEFLRIFYRQEELRKKMRRHLLSSAKELTHDERLRHAEFSFALASAFDDREMRWALERNALQVLMGNEASWKRVKDFMDFAKLEAEVRDRAEHLERFEKLRALASVVMPAVQGQRPPSIKEIFLRSPMNIVDKESILESLRSDSEGIGEQLADSLVNHDQHLFELIGNEVARKHLQSALEDGHMISFDDIDGARIAEEVLGAKGLVVLAKAMHRIHSRSDGPFECSADEVLSSCSPLPMVTWLEFNSKGAPEEYIVKLCDRIADLDIDSAAALSHLSDILHKQGFFALSVEVLRRLAAMAPHDWAYWSNLGNALNRIGEAAEAESAYLHAAELAPNAGPIWINLGILYHGQGDLERSKKAFQRGQSSEDDKPVSMWGYARFLRNHGRLNEAAEVLRNAINSEPDQPSLWLDLGVTLEQLGSREQAEEAYRKATAFSGEDEAPWLALGGLMIVEQRLAEAEIAFRNALEIDCNSWAALVGIALSLRDRPDEKEEVLRKAIAVNPRDSSSRNTLAWMLFASNQRLDEAEALAREAKELDSAPEVLHTLACILVRRNRWHASLEPARQFLRAWATEVPEHLWRDVILFFREAVDAGKAREAAELLDELNLGERWRPLREALEAIARGSDTYLRRVAPEVREPVEAILKELREPIEIS